MARLTANKLAKAYRGREVVKDVSIDLESGQVVGLLGPNGAGKTTCFYMIVGIINADPGTIEINGEDITALPMHVTIIADILTAVRKIVMLTCACLIRLAREVVCPRARRPI